MIGASEIFPGLWQGAQPPEGALVEQAGFNLLVLCAIEYQPPAHAFPGVEVLHTPFEDTCARMSDIALLGHLRFTVLRTIQVVRSQRKALVTCHAGLNRSGLVTGLVLRGLTSASGSDIIDRIRDCRGMWALSNSQFRRIVLDSGRLRTYFEHGLQI